jgi:hypothetical protein
VNLKLIRLRVLLADKIPSSAESLGLGHGRVALEIKREDVKVNSHGTPTKTQRTGDECKNNRTTE